MDSRLRAIADHFLTKSDAPSVDPASIDPQLLPYVYIIEVERDLNVRLRVRFVGTALDKFFQRPVVGHVLDEFIHGPRGRDVLRRSAPARELVSRSGCDRSCACPTARRASSRG